MAWLSDFFDGRLARSTPHDTRLGEWDFRVDALVGAGILVGLGIASILPIWVVAVFLLALGATVLTNNPTPAMLMIGVSYAVFLWFVLNEAANLALLPVIAVIPLTVLDWRRFTTVILPAFFHGAAQLLKGHVARGDHASALDDWSPKSPRSTQGDRVE